MEPLQVAQHMEAIIRRLTEESKVSEEFIDEMAQATAKYKKERAVQEMTKKAEGVAVTMVKHQAEGGVVADLEADMIRATQALKAHFAKREDLRAQLNGWQSINKYLDSIT